MVDKEITIDASHVSGISGRYAYALFRLALERDKLSIISGELSELRRLVSSNEQLLAFITSPLYSSGEQNGVMMDVVQKLKFADICKNFVGVIIQNRRLYLLEDIIERYFQIVSSYNGEMKADIVSARELEKVQVTKLEKELKKLAGKEIVCSFEIDPHLLGGMIVKLGSRMFDSSLRTKLSNLKIAMKEVG